MNSEITSLHISNTRNLVLRDKACNVLSAKWVYRVNDVIPKSGNLDQIYKAKLVARGFQQIKGMDYEERFAPVISFPTLRLFLSLVAKEDLELHQMDMKTAFLYGELDEDIFMEQPKGFEDPNFPDYRVQA